MEPTYSVLNLTKSLAISNMRKCKKVTGEKEPHATRASGVFPGVTGPRLTLCVGKVYSGTGISSGRGLEVPAEDDDTDSGCCCRAPFEGVISVAELIVR